MLVQERQSIEIGAQNQLLRFIRSYTSRCAVSVWDCLAIVLLIQWYAAVRSQFLAAFRRDQIRVLPPFLVSHNGFCDYLPNIHAAGLSLETTGALSHVAKQVSLFTIRVQIFSPDQRVDTQLAEHLTKGDSRAAKRNQRYAVVAKHRHAQEAFPLCGM